MTPKNKFLLAAVAAVLVVVMVYSNHFNNAFHFDDSHTIGNNFFIKDLKNFKLFFTSAETFSSLPSNQSYRPMFTWSVALDYYFAGKQLNPFYFHLHNFIYFILQLVLLFFLLKKIASYYTEEDTARWLGLMGALFYGVHAANAETINYISARSDSFSTTWMLAAFCVYVYFPEKRRYGIYILPFAVSFLFKPVTIVFPLLVFLYSWFFEKQKSLGDALDFKQLKDPLSVVVKLIPLMVVSVFLYELQSKLTSATFTPGGTSTYKYIISQPFVILHYFKNFFLPTDLSADTDWTVIDGMGNWRFWTGTVFLIALVAVSVRASKIKEWRPVAFGLLWFLITLLPTSLIPLSEVLNDHRPFIAYIGLLFACCWSVYLLVRSRSVMFFRTVLVLFFAATSVFAYGTRERNKVWHTSESLWKDVTEKSPANGRGWMNYGLVFMERAEFAKAEEAFNNALQLLPAYSYLQINLGILYSNTNRKALAEKSFNKALLLDETNPECYYYFASYMYREKRPYDARVLLERGLALSPAHMPMRYLLMNAYSDLYEWDKLKALCTSTLAILPEDATSRQFLAMTEKRITRAEMALEDAKQQPSPEKYLDASLQFYNEKNYEACIEACRNALELKPDYAPAWNNICSSYNSMGEFDKAEEAANNALKIDPSYQLAKNNLALVQSNRVKLKIDEAKVKSDPSADNYLNLSLTYYNSGNYRKCIEACEQVLKLNPNSALAWNNICTSYNMLKEWDKAVEAGNKALQIDPNLELAKNNLRIAKEHLTK